MKNIRRAKVTLYLDVPVLDNDNLFVDKTQILNTCEKSLNTCNFKINAPSDIILEPINSDNLEDMVHEAKNNNDNVVGFLTPDGKWYLMCCIEDNLAHITLSNILYPYYKYELGYSFIDDNTNMLDYTLEKNGFIKVHGRSIRYFSNVGPKINDNQINELIKYMKLQDEIFINDKFVDKLKMCQMDKISFNKVFEL